jgi:malonyl CoA-acyl carrier protein transacylase
MGIHFEMRIIFLFAGQGYSNENLYDLLLSDEQSKAWLDQYQKANDFEYLDMVKKIKNPKHSQLLISSYQICLFNALKPLLDKQDVTLAGYSLGEVSAFLASCDADISTAYKCVSKRTRLMQIVAKEDAFDLVAIKGNLDQQLIEALCKKHHCGISIINSDDHYVIGGKIIDLKKILKHAKRLHIEHEKWLDINIPSHTPYFLVTVEKYLKYLNKKFKDFRLEYPIISPVALKKVFDIESEIKLLSKELCQTLHWHTVCELIPEFGYDLIIDIGPGSSMTSIFSPTNKKNIPVVTCSDFKSLDGLKSHIKQIVTE